MKKTFLGLGIAAALNLAAVAGETELFVSDLLYYWNYKTNNCAKTDFESKGMIMKDVEKGVLIINKQYINDAGKWTWLEGEMSDGKPYAMNFFTTYGECRVFEKAIIKDQKIDNWDYFAKLKDPALAAKK